jgi:16S rRNA (guanine527-N7)-methyltransferase
MGEPGRWLPLLERHAHLIEAAAPRVRVTAVASAHAIRRHYAEALELWRIANARAETVRLVDVGSGGGFPGLVIAMVEPDLDVHLVEPLQKRARLLAEFAAELGISNVTVHALRAEDAGRGGLRDSAGLVTARAVAELRELLEYTAPFAAPGGVLAFPKGSALEAEVAAAANAMRELAAECMAVEPMRPEISTTLRVALFRRTSATDARYPRRAGVPGRKPL